MAGKQSHDYRSLTALLVKDDQQALKALYDGLGADLFQFALSITYSREIAEEVIQDVFMQVWNNRMKLDEAQNLRLYMYVATRNTAISHLRKVNRHRSFSLDEIKLPYLKVDLNPEDQMISNELLHRINLAINNLPQQCKLIFKLVKQDGFRYREAAELLEISQKTVENQLGIAIKKLHAALRLAAPGNKSSTG